MAAVVAEQEITFLQSRSDGNPGPFLTNTGMHGTGQFTLCKQFEQALLNTANEQCLRVQLGQYLSFLLDYHTDEVLIFLRVDKGAPVVNSCMRSDKWSRLSGMSALP